MCVRRWSSRSRIALVAVLLAGVTPLLTAPGRVWAINEGCRTDPVIILSDGTLIDISAEVQTALYNVQQVSYTLHAPEGTSLGAVVFTPGWPGSTESLDFYPDQPAGQFRTDTVVQTSDKGVAVTAVTIVGSTQASASGFDRQHLKVKIIRRPEQFATAPDAATDLISFPDFQPDILASIGP